ncbi:MAG: leucyl aminopeptidase [Elusimicrobia bacterium]|jgi:leucyl aminopeptidase|nr:leucyl aminopeptidase [Elusimicrobiota bacterium]
MKILFSPKTVARLPVVVPAVLVGKEWRVMAGSLSASLLAQAREDGFTGKRGTVVLIRPVDRQPAERVLLVGLGEKSELDGNAFRRAAAAVVRFSVEAHLPRVQFLVPDLSALGKELDPLGCVQSLAEGAGLGAYVFDACKSERAKRAGILEMILVSDRLAVKNGNESLARGVLFAEATNFTRDLINRPPSDKRPEQLAVVARSLAGRGVTVRVYGKAELKRMGAHALLGVNRGSAHPPVLVHFRYRPSVKTRGSVAFVGKGVTFDSGGLSLKPADGMMTMKYDMAGAATVFSMFKVLPRLKPSVEVHGVAVLTENMPGPDAYKPGDVVKAMNGKTIEVLNTDAEGRVILADALSFTAKLPVDAIIDVATLTGAAGVALGKTYAALMTDHPDLEKELRSAGDRAGEKMWPLPLEKGYLEHIQSKVADWKNIGNPGEAGTIVGGLFLQQFAGKGPWAHVDMASVGWNGNGTPLSPPGATGALVRTFLTLAVEWKGRKK